MADASRWSVTRPSNIRTPDVNIFWTKHVSLKFCFFLKFHVSPFFRYLLQYLWSTQCKLDWMQPRHLALRILRITKCLPNKTSRIKIWYWEYINSYLQFWSCKRFPLHICCYWLPWRFLLRILYHAFESRIKKMINYMYLLWSFEKNNKQNTIYALSIINEKSVNRFI